MNDKTENLPAIKGQAPKPGNPVQAMVPTTQAEMAWTIGVIVRGGLAPDSYKKNGLPDENAMAIGIMKGLELGVPPLTALANIAIINGRPTMWGDLMVAMVQKTGLLVGIKETEIGALPDAGADLNKFPDDYGIEVALSRKGVDGAFVGRFTVGDAARAHLWMSAKKPWTQYPKRMLRQRALGFALRNGFADCLAGMYSREEADDMPRGPKIVNRDFLDASPVKSSSEPVVIENQPAAESSADPGISFDLPENATESDLVDAPSESDATAGWPYYREDGDLIATYDNADQWIESLSAAVEIEAARDGMTWPTPTFKANQVVFRTAAETAEQREKLLKIQTTAFGKAKP